MPRKGMVLVLGLVFRAEYRAVSRLCLWCHVEANHLKHSPVEEGEQLSEESVQRSMIKGRVLVHALIPAAYVCVCGAPLCRRACALFGLLQIWIDVRFGCRVVMLLNRFFCNMRSQVSKGCHFRATLQVFSWACPCHGLTNTICSPEWCSLWASELCSRIQNYLAHLAAALV